MAADAPAPQRSLKSLDTHTLKQMLFGDATWALSAVGACSEAMRALNASKVHSAAEWAISALQT